MRRAAAVVLQAAGNPVRCVIWDMSDGGARLAIAHPAAELPRHLVAVELAAAAKADLEASPLLLDQDHCDLRAGLHDVVQSV